MAQDVCSASFLRGEDADSWSKLHKSDWHPTWALKRGSKELILMMAGWNRGSKVKSLVAMVGGWSSKGTHCPLLVTATQALGGHMFTGNGKSSVPIRQIPWPDFSWGPGCFPNSAVLAGLPGFILQSFPGTLWAGQHSLFNSFLLCVKSANFK